MAHVVRLFSGRGFLGGRAVAHRARTEATLFLASHADGVVVLDFARVDGVSHSFADELLTPLAEMLDNAVPKRVKLANCSASTLADLQSVAEMHHLPMPELCVSVLA